MLAAKSIFKTAALTICLVMVISAAKYFLPTAWPLAVAAICVVVQIISFAVSRHVVFGRCQISTMDDSQSATLRQFANEQGVGNLEIFVVDEGAADSGTTAAYSPLPRPCVFLGKSLLAELSQTELKAVFAHELGHAKNEGLAGHLFFLSGQLLASLLTVWLGLFFINYGNTSSTICLITCFMFVVGLEFLRIAALLAVGWIFFRPLFCFLSRRSEFAANRFALRSTGDSDAFVSAMQKLWRLKNPQAPDENIGMKNARPTLWQKMFVNSHPTLAEVISQA